MSHVCNQTNPTANPTAISTPTPAATANVEASPKLSFGEPEYYGSGISVKTIDFEAKGTTPPFKSTYFEVLPGYTTPVDQHKVEECWIVLKGSGLLVCDGQELPLSAQDIVHFSSFKGHSVQNNSDEPLLLCSIYW